LWARGGNFITRNVTVKRGGETTLEGWQIIGWDPIEERIRSWIFDGEGGFAEGWWTSEGERWLLRETSVSPDGSRTGTENTITKLGPDRFAWESNNRTLDGQPQPNIDRIEISRRAIHAASDQSRSERRTTTAASSGCLSACPNTRADAGCDPATRSTACG
jgi:hypothetical protein